MLPVSARFLDAVTKPHRVVTEILATPPGGSAIPVRRTAGTLSVDVDARIRSRVSLTALVTADEWSVFSVPGCRFSVRHGIQFGGSDQELVSLFVGELSETSRSLSPNAGEAKLTLQDLGGWVTRSELLAPASFPAGMSRALVIELLVQGALPGVQVVNVSSGGGVLPAGYVAARRRFQAVGDMELDGRMVSYFNGSGEYVIRDAPRLVDAAVFTLRQFVQVSRARPLDRLYNTVVVSPGSSDGSQSWPVQTVRVTDPFHPRHPSRVGVVPLFVDSITAASASEALAIGRNELDKVLGSTESLSLGLVANPALEVGDLVRVVTPQVNEERADILQHYVDGLSINLVSGLMGLSTRSQGV